jgi:hypothetical protein
VNLCPAPSAVRVTPLGVPTAVPNATSVSWAFGIDCAVLPAVQRPPTVEPAPGSSGSPVFEPIVTQVVPFQRTRLPVSDSSTRNPRSPATSVGRVVLVRASARYSRASVAVASSPMSVGTSTSSVCSG